MNGSKGKILKYHAKAKEYLDYIKFEIQNLADDKKSGNKIFHPDHDYSTGNQKTFLSLKLLIFYFRFPNKICLHLLKVGRMLVSR